MKTSVENQDYKSPEQQQQDAWFAVYETLCEVAPELMYGNHKNGRETACDAIRTLAKQSKAGELTMEVTTVAINKLTEKIKAQEKQLNLYRHFA